MKIQSMIAVYFVIWWITLFAVLPLGVKSAHETGTQVEEGHDPGAPAVTRVWRVVSINTVVAAFAFALVYYMYTHGWFG
ncbi:DUF1467 family protein [Aestuariivirga litoralis]|uniref:DUF1467 family protein n=1 Tax=Aestuariivirga litoralis TaxID=2650924 RepID=UPI0018C6AEC2|nr:DUF1467 family protein [Aestuariivirga litoralis]MBG1231307.1 DUF1467 family protein [Aestuariivirga litoralis]